MSRGLPIQNYVKRPTWVSYLYWEPLSNPAHHALACYLTKFESHSSIICSNNGAAFAQQESLQPRRAIKVKGQDMGQSLPNFVHQVSRLHSCANTINNTGNSKQRFVDCTGLPFFRHKLVQAFGTSCVLALADSTLCCWINITGYSCLVLPRTVTNRRHRFLCLLRAAQLPSQDCVCSPVCLYSTDVRYSQ